MKKEDGKCMKSANDRPGIKTTIECVKIFKKRKHR
jgi:hypothetical protein